MLEIAYHVATPGKTFSITIAASALVGWPVAKTVFHGTSLAAARVIMEEGFKTSYGAWREKLKRFKCGHVPAVYCSPVWHTAAGYGGNTPDTR